MKSLLWRALAAAALLVVGACGPEVPGDVGTSVALPLATSATVLSTSGPPGSSHPAGSQPADPWAVTPGEIIDTAAVLALLDEIPQKGRAPKTGYSRDQFGDAWTDNVDVEAGHNGCDTRNDILRRDLTELGMRADAVGCVVLTGVLQDTYTGAEISFTRGQTTSSAVQIDHVVALSDAWQKGAQQLTEVQRRNLANDPLNLQAVDGPTNGQKGDGDAATWLPPNKEYRCLYVARQTLVKAKYSLWMTAAESAAVRDILAGCPVDMTLPAPVPDRAPTVECYPLSNGGNCYLAGQMCAQRYRGERGIAANSKPIECLSDGENWYWQLAD